MTDLIADLRERAGSQNGATRRSMKGLLDRAADELSALRERVEAMEGVLEDGLGHLDWINAQAENAMATVATVIAANEDGNVSLMMLDSIASDIGINAMMFGDKARAILAQKGGEVG